MGKNYRFPLAIATLSLALPGCTGMQQIGSNYGQQIGCLTGALAGAVIGQKLGDDSTGALIGAGVGTAIGCYAGSVWQSRMQALEHIAKEENLPLTVTSLQNQTSASQPKEAGLVAQMQDSSMFATGSSDLTNEGRRKIQKLAAAFAQELGGKSTASERYLLVVGHTDATGSAEFNQKLSEKRARAVGQLLQHAGVPTDRIYFQGAGSSRPIADNSTQQGRNLNRRVEINEVASKELLVQRINAEASNAKYLAYGTTTQPTQISGTTNQDKAQKSTSKQNDSNAQQTPPSHAKSLAKIDFGGQPSHKALEDITTSIKPKSGGFALINNAHANEIPIQNCYQDAPRQSGKVLSLNNEQPLNTYNTREFLPGYNNKVWANTINGHLVTISPVSILKENAEIAQQPFLQIVEKYDTGNRKANYKLSAIANTFEGEDKVLYRVFTTSNSAPISCLDIVFEKDNAKALDGQLFYPNGTTQFVAQFIPIKA
ncbi:OmpA family protein [Balneatrix alpica]|uniref:OmpA family protein n=1 Tax=Balneatrix alpica TaxID=75684 RepID=UPI002739019C|nr:OmpA family protein [Balneatrix alpica]